jgi:hypothetical protein
MAIGTAAAIGIGLAGVGAGASAISANKASKRAAAASQANSDANIALTRDIYGQNKAILSPFVQRGDQAGSAINALLGLGGAQQMQPAPTAPTGPFAPQFSNPLLGAAWQGAQGMVAQEQGGPATMDMGGQPAGAAYGIGDSAMLGNGITPTMTGSNPMVGQQTAQQAQNAAFENFRNSTGYQFRLGEGLDAVSSAYAGIGGLQSGAAMRGINEYGQNFASNEFGNYANLLSNQQAVGAGAGSALAGVGQNFASNVIGQNNFNTQNQMAAQLGQQNILGNMAGMVGGGLLSYGGRK